MTKQTMRSRAAAHATVNAERSGIIDPKPSSHDLIFTDLGTVWSVKATSDAGREFLDERVAPVESWMGSQHDFTSDWRPMRDLARFAQSEGLSVGGRS